MKFLWSEVFPWEKLGLKLLRAVHGLFPASEAGLAFAGCDLRGEFPVDGPALADLVGVCPVAYRQARQICCAQGGGLHHAGTHHGHIDDIGLEAAGVNRERNRIPVDEHMRTNVDNIYAIGDITAVKQLAHVATYQGTVAVENILGHDVKADYSVIPACVFVSPVISMVGLSEKELQDRGIEYESVSYNVGANGKALLSQKGEGTVIIYYRKDDKRILGCQMIAEGSSEMINEISVIMKKGGSLKDIASTVHPHPTIGEIVKEASEKGC